MEWIKIREEQIYTADDEDFYRYWMDVADPRETYLQEFEDYRMCGGGLY